MRNTSETDYDVIKYNHMSAQTGIFYSFCYASVLSCADHTYLRKKMYESFVLHCFIHQCHLMDDVCTDMLNLFKHYYAGRLWSFGRNGS